MAYIQNKMSERAVQAYLDGLRPRSKWTKSDILYEVSDFYQQDLAKYPTEILREAFLHYEEWHHTGSAFNTTPFYSCSAGYITCEDLEELYSKYKADKLAKKKQKEADMNKQKALIEYGEWSGPKSHMRLSTKKSYALLDSKWAYLPDGRRKALNGRHIKVLDTYSKAPRGTAQAFKNIERTL